MEEILQDPARFEELLRERKKPPAKPVKKFVLPVWQSGHLRSSERVAVAGKDGESGVTESPPITLVSENPLRDILSDIALSKTISRTTTVLLRKKYG